MSARATIPTSSVPAAPTAGDGEGAAAPRRRRSFARWSPGGAVGVTLLAFVVLQVVAALALLAGHRDDPTWLDGASLVVADLAMLGTVVWFARRGADRLGPATFGLQRTDARAAFGWGALAYLGYVAFAGMWAALVGSGHGSHGATSAPDAAPLALALLFLGVTVVTPIAEETVFRGYLFAALTRWKGPWPAAVVSGLLFGAAHVLVYPPAMLAPLAIMGILLALVFWWSGSLLPCIALHSANNALVLAISVGWSWQVPLALVGMPLLTVLALLPVSAARRRAPGQASAA